MAASRLSVELASPGGEDSDLGRAGVGHGPDEGLDGLPALQPPGPRVAVARVRLGVLGEQLEDHLTAGGDLLLAAYQLLFLAVEERDEAASYLGDPALGHLALGIEGREVDHFVEGRGHPFGRPVESFGKIRHAEIRVFQ